MNKLEVGMYVRYISGFNNDKPIVRIGKVIEVLEYTIELDTFRSGVFSKSEFLKLCMVGEPSFNIIDLIKKKDIILGKDGKIYEVSKIYKDYVFTTTITKEGLVKTLVDYQIDKILTKEQFKRESYKVG